jgi:hypothetical protein
MDKGKLIFILMIAVVVVGMVIYSIIVFGGGGSKNEYRSVNFKPDDIVKDDKRLAYNSRMEKARRGMSEERQQKAQEHPFVQTDTASEDEPKGEPQPEQKPVEKPKNRQVTKPLPKPIEPVEEPVAQPQQPTRSGGFGVVSSGSKPKDSGGEVQQPAQGVRYGYVSAILEEDITISHDGTVVFYVLDDFEIRGEKVKRNSYLFGKVRESSLRFDIHIERIQTTTGSIINLSEGELVVFDELYSRGLSYDGDASKAIREGTTDGALEGVNQVVQDAGALGGTVGRTAAQVVSRTISRANSRSKPNTLSLRRGYRVYVQVKK